MTLVSREHSLVVRTVLSVLVVLVLVATVYGACEVYFEFEYEAEHDQQLLDQYISARKPALINAAYLSDPVLSQQIIKGFLANEIVQGARLEDDTNAVLAEGRNEPVTNVIPFISILLSETKVLRSIPLIEDAPASLSSKITQYGTLYLEIDYGGGMNRSFARSVQLLWMKFFLSIILVTFILMIVLRRIIISPLQQVVLDVQRPIDLSFKVSYPPGHEKDEIGALVTAVNASIERQQQQLAQIAGNEQRLKSILDGAGDACMLFNLSDGQIVYANDATFRLLDFSEAELLDRKIFDISAALDSTEWNERVRIVTSIQAHQREGTLLAKDGREIPVESTSSTIELDGKRLLLSFMRDTRSRKHLETNLAHAQRLTALGELTGGVAHDFNNMLQLIQGALDVIKMDPERRSPDVERSLTIAFEASKQGADLIRQLLDFSRKQILDPEVVDLALEIKKSLPLLEQASGKLVNLDFSTDCRTAKVKLDTGALNNALLNLIVNARHSMPVGGQLSLSLNPLSDEDRIRHLPKDLSSQDLVCLSIRDTGTGMSRAVSERIFEPFYTTKMAGEGTGMGLAMVFGFVTQSGGHIRVASELNLGTTFYLYVPTTDEAISSVTEKPKPVVAHIAAKTGAEAQHLTVEAPDDASQRARILLVDDHADIRFIAKTYLELAGHDVLEAATLSDARANLAKQILPINLLLTDLALPSREDGLSLINLCQETYPTVKVGVISGHVPNFAREAVTNLATHQLLSKPFTQEGLREFVDQLLKA